MTEATLYHLLFALGLVVAYVVLVVTGHDGTPLFAVLVGQGSGAVIERRITKESQA